MKRFLALAILLSLILSVAARSAGMATDRPESGMAGYLSLDSCTLDLGTVKPDTIAEGVLHFRNTGDAPLQILSVFSDCGCTSTEYTRDAVEPGGSGDIRIRFNSKGRKAGPFRKVLRVRSTAANPRVSVTVKGIVGP